MTLCSLREPPSTVRCSVTGSRVVLKTGRSDILATVYRTLGQALIAIGGWAEQPESVKLTVDLASLGLNPAKVKLVAPDWKGFQSSAEYRPNQTIPVEP